MTNTHYLHDSTSLLIEVHGENAAIEALDAEYWTNSLNDAEAQRLNDAVTNAPANISWPISGDTIAAIRATA